ncbi:hypothetical protein J7E88_28085 [Streptomyces sp. ISL-10]|uniref:hypothetical protein n=1 Tax=Streptomyces sp. ISL-10 TaxID=2819172 RepID=UPI001BEB8C34|nr:hypothetical protein [Streptomyces sp. ISL-10]
MGRAAADLDAAHTEPLRLVREADGRAAADLAEHRIRRFHGTPVEGSVSGHSAPDGPESDAG